MKLLIQLLVTTFALCCCASAAASNEVQPSANGNAAKSGPSSNPTTQACGPIEDSSWILEYGQTAAVCSPVILAAGAKGMSPSCLVESDQDFAELCHLKGNKYSVLQAGNSPS